MKKFLCILFCILGSSFILFWSVAYIAFKCKTQIPEMFLFIMIVNAAIILLSIIIGLYVIKVSVAQWFPYGDSDLMVKKDMILIMIAVLIALICGGVFVFTIINNNFSATETTEFDNMLLRMLMLIMANDFMAFSYYQHFQVIKFRR